MGENREASVNKRYLFEYRIRYTDSLSPLHSLNIRLPRSGKRCHHPRSHSTVLFPLLIIHARSLIRSVADYVALSDIAFEWGDSYDAMVQEV